MTATKRVEKTRRLYAEFPVFEDDDADVSLVNRFSEELFSLVRNASHDDPESHYRLVCELEENADDLSATFTLSRRRGNETVKKRLLVAYENGYIKEYKEI